MAGYSCSSQCISGVCLPVHTAVGEVGTGHLYEVEYLASLFLAKIQFF